MRGIVFFLTVFCTLMFIRFVIEPHVIDPAIKILCKEVVKCEAKDAK